MTGDGEETGRADDSPADPHADQPVVTAGAPVRAADVAVVCLHGRGATADGVVRLAEDGFYRHGVALVAPQAARSRWFPYSFLAPLGRNEPHLSSALRAVDGVVADLVGRGVPRERVVLFGFSQGACLAAEYAVRHPRRYGGAAVLNGGLLGPPGTDWAATGSLDGTPVLVAGGGADERVPVERIRETAGVFRDLDADVTERVYEGVGHHVVDDEFAFVAGLLDGIVGQ